MGGDAQTLLPDPGTVDGGRDPVVGPDSDGDSGSVPGAPTIDSTGTVRAFTPGSYMRVANAKVALRDLHVHSSVVTSADWTFRVSDVRPPYAALKPNRPWLA